MFGFMKNSCSDFKYQARLGLTYDVCKSITINYFSLAVKRKALFCL